MSSKATRGDLSGDAPGDAALRRYADFIEALGADVARSPVRLCEIGAGDSGVVEALGRRASMLHYDGVGTLPERRRALAALVAEARFDQVPSRCDWLLIDAIPVNVDLERWLSDRWAGVQRGMMFRLKAVHDGTSAPRFPLPLDTLAALLHEWAGHRIRFSVDYGDAEYRAFAWREAPGDAVAAIDPGELVPHVVPVCRPKMVKAEALLPYLRVLDESRHYSNYGPLVQRLEARLAQALNLPRDTVTTASSGTAALVGAILAGQGRASDARPYCAMPSYTFVATAVAAEHCGYQPLLLDVDPEDWQLHPEAVRAHPLFDRVGLVMPVAPYGRGVPQSRWTGFAAETGIDIVIDGAASFEACADDPACFLGPLPVALSLHATKALATGEGGAIVCTQPERIARSVQTLNFGFRLTREARAPGSNGKMSEYHAAVGLAELDGWDRKRNRFSMVAEAFLEVATTFGFEARLRSSPLLASNYLLLALDDEEQAGRVGRSLSDHRVDHRLWYGRGLHRQPYYADCPAAPMPVCDRLAPTLLGLPMSVDMNDEDVTRTLYAVHLAIG